MNIWQNSRSYNEEFTYVIYIQDARTFDATWDYPDSNVHGANIAPTWVLSAPDGPHVVLMNRAIMVNLESNNIWTIHNVVLTLIV